MVGTAQDVEQWQDLARERNDEGREERGERGEGEEGGGGRSRQSQMCQSLIFRAHNRFPKRILFEVSHRAKVWRRGFSRLHQSWR